MGEKHPIEDFVVDREDVILLILQANERLFRKKIFRGITRLEKLVFLLSKETSFEGVVDNFTFRAYHYGPFSAAIYEAIEFLEGHDFIAVGERSFSQFESVEEEELVDEISDSELERMDSGYEVAIKERTFELTDIGRKLACALETGIKAKKPSDVSALENIVKKYGNLPLGQLIRYVYHRYPSMTEKSIHPEASRVDINRNKDGKQ